ncbi:HXXEE domain-containing protein [Chelatococcus sp. GCM10030263]|uniref:HXXEE domain-containing protein n=1 Tax=Chelatococcus sp. GCM10030263 TaxID=3273387 RepID=UPI00361CADC5
MKWFLHNWMYGGFIAGLFLLAVLPVVADALSPALIAVYLQLPIYMLHQLEEHDRDRFRRAANTLMAGGREALTTPAVVLINVVGVWIVDLVALYLARFVHLGFGLIAIYLMLVNAVVHIVGAIVMRGYNPGLATSIVLFLPAGLGGLWLVSAAPEVTAADHILGLGIAIVLHAVIIIHVKRRAAMLARAA